MKKVTIECLGYVVEAIVDDENEHIQRCWVNGNFYETQRNGLLAYIAANEKKGQKIIDIGASIGNHSMFFASVMEASELHCIEPCEDSYSHLIDNVTLNDNWFNYNYASHNIAVGAKVGHAIMQQMSVDNVGMKQVKEIDLIKGVNTEDVVRVLPIDELEYFEGYGFIKIDIEHYNEEMLIGAKETFTKGTGNIYIEAETDEVLKVTDKYMNEYGYKRVEGLVLNHTPTYKYIK